MWFFEFGYFQDIFLSSIFILKIFHIFRFFFESERGLFPNTEFVFDLELPLDFIPKNADGEVETFELLPAKQCLEKILTEDFKTTSSPVALDFLIRHGVVTAENGKYPSVKINSLWGWRVVKFHDKWFAPSRHPLPPFLSLSKGNEMWVLMKNQNSF